MEKLTHIVTVGILNERKGVEGDLVHELDSLVVRSMVNATLQNAGSMPVRGNFDTVGSDSVVDELMEMVSPTAHRRENTRDMPGYPLASACSGISG